MKQAILSYSAALAAFVFWGGRLKRSSTFLRKKCIRVTWLEDVLTSKWPGFFDALRWRRHWYLDSSGRAIISAGECTACTGHCVLLQKSSLLSHFNFCIVSSKINLLFLSQVTSDRCLSGIMWISCSNLLTAQTIFDFIVYCRCILRCITNDYDKLYYKNIRHWLIFPCSSQNVDISRHHNGCVLKRNRSGSIHLLAFKTIWAITAWSENGGKPTFLLLSLKRLDQIWSFWHRPTYASDSL